ncbi:hypothetical protein HJFPF1_03027 [Paramyrothecium foliicola]|nr:hypothetical protein HJFPF1_03027 [Paramyrothecium foliicola]
MLCSPYGLHNPNWASAMTGQYFQGRTIPSAPSAALLWRTVQAHIEPGDKTGVYYILLCNLPFGTTWQGLLAFVTPVCTVDHVQVFHGSTSGWVRVVGKNNFEKAWKHLNGGLFNGRHIVASDKNRSEAIKIKELARMPRPSAPGRTQSRTRRFQSGPPAHYDTLASCLSLHQSISAPHAWLSLGGCQISPRVPPPFPLQPLAVTDHNLTHSATNTCNSLPGFVGEGGPGCLSLEGGSGGHPLAQLQRAVPSEFWPLRPPPFGVGQARPLGNGQQNNPMPSIRANGHLHVRTEARKILVTPFAQETTAAEIKSWVHSHLDSHQIADIQVPFGSQWNRIRGHAFIVFRDTTATTKAIATLDRREFRGRPVRVRLTKEGVMVWERPSAEGPSTNTQSCGPNRGRANSREAVSMPANSDPLCVERSGSSEPKARDDSKLVIANGTSSKNRAGKQSRSNSEASG